MKTSEFLKIVKRDYLARSFEETLENENKSRFLCLAIEYAGDSMNKQRLASKLIARIEEALEGCNTVESWLYRNGHITQHVQLHGNAIYEYRHRWIDSLIEEYEAKGD